MDLQFKEISNKLGDWIATLTPNQSNGQLISTLALIRVYQLNIGSWEVELKKKVHTFIDVADELDYSKSDLTMALLACDLVLELGNDEQVEHASFYTSILKELSFLDKSSRNSNILMAAFNQIKPQQKKQMLFEIPMHARNIDKMILNVLEDVEKQSCFGQLDFTVDDFSVLQLESMAIRAQRSYDFPLAMRCLRTRNYLSSANSLMMNTSLNFIKYEQNIDGSIGDYQADVQSVEDVEERRTILLKIKTVVALEVIWTIYEWKENNLLASLSHLKVDESVNDLKPV
jgi:hypothetical protein